MPAKPQQPDLTSRQDLTYFEGVNSLVGHNLAQKQELYHAENVRSKDIGILEKREGTARVGNPLDASANYLLTDFLNTGVNNSGLYRISTVSEQTNLYFLNSLTQSWNPGVAIGLLELGNFSTVYNITKLGSTVTYSYVSGAIPSFSTKLHVGTVVIIQAQNFNPLNNGTFAVASVSANSFSVTNASGVAEAGKSIGSGFIRIDLSVGNWTGGYSSTIAEGHLFLVNGMTQNQSVPPSGNSLGTTHLINSPRARKINYYKDKLYLGDYFIDSPGTSEYFLGSASTAYDITDTSRAAVNLGDSTTAYDITNPTGFKFTYTYSSGTNPNIGSKVQINDQVVISANNFSGGNNGTFTVTDVTTNSFSVTNALGVVESNKTIGPTGSIVRSFVPPTSSAVTYTFSGGTNPSIGSKVHDGDVLVISAQNFNAANNGTFVVTAHTTTSFTVSNSSGVPETGKTVGTGSIHHFATVSNTAGTEYPTGVMMSSVPLGILALVDGDVSATGTPGVDTTTIPVTDTKYVDIPSVVFVMRGNQLITILNVVGKTETSLLIDSTSHPTLLAADELWVDSSITGNRQFKWNSVPSSGIDVKQYDTFKLTGANQNDRIRMLTNIGNVMVIGNTENIGIWDNYKLDMMDGGIGCVADNGFTKAQGQLFFLHYSGIYMTQGGQPQLISGAVSRYIRGATRAGLENAAMGIVSRKAISIFCSIGDVTLYREDGSFEKTLNNVVLEYNLQQKIWFVHSELKARIWSSYIEATDPNKLVFASDDAVGGVYEFLTGSTDTQDGTVVANIPMRMDTVRMYMGKQYDRIGQALEVGVEAERGANIRTFISLDAQPFYEIPGQSSKGISILKVANVDGDQTTPPRCRFLRVSLRDYSNQTVKVSRIFLTHIESTERENIRTEGSAEA